MSGPSIDSAVKKLHEAYSSLNVSLAYINSSERTLQQCEAVAAASPLLSNLQSAGNCLLSATSKLRDAEAVLRDGPQDRRAEDAGEPHR